jgi:hypothetical protein
MTTILPLLGAFCLAIGPAALVWLAVYCLQSGNQDFNDPHGN